MARAGTTALTTTAAAIYTPATDGPATSIQIKSAAANAVNVLINVAGLHNANEFHPLEPGDVVVYRAGEGGLGAVTAKSASGTPSIHHGIVALT